MPADDDKPPILGSWTAAYALVLGTLAVLTVAFTALSWIYR